MELIGAILALMIVGFIILLFFGMLIQMLGGLMLLFEGLEQLCDSLLAQCAPFRAVNRTLSFLLALVFGMVLFLYKFISFALLMPFKAFDLIGNGTPRLPPGNPM